MSMATNSFANWETNDEIRRFREYLRIASVHPDIDYEPCVDFLRAQARDLGLPVEVYHPVNEKNPIVVLTWLGTRPEMSSILLNSHMDVVPVFAENWTHPPFGADMDAEGRIFGRGSQDMKSVGMQYLAAIRALKGNGVRFKRSIHVSFVPDEEKSGEKGMRPFVHTKEFETLCIGFSLDEGIASPTNVYPVFYGERSVWRITFKISGNSGHGSLLLPNTAGEKLQYILNRMMDMRKEQVHRLKENSALSIGDVTTINLTMISGGKQINVIPPIINASFDIRLAIDVDPKQFQDNLEKWCEEAGGDIEIEYETKRPHVKLTDISDGNQFWVAFKKSINYLGLEIKTEIFAGGTDSRYIRERGIPAIGFSPMNNTPVLLHSHDEFIRAETYLKGIDIYQKIISGLADCD